MWTELLLMFLLLILYIYSIARKPKGFPPGNIIRGLALWYKRRILHQVGAELSKEYGSVIGFKFWGRKQIVAVNGKEAAFRVLTDKAFDSRPSGIAVKLMYKNIRGGILMSNGELWQQQRKFTVQRMRDLGFGKRTMEDLLVDEALHFVDKLKQMIVKTGHPSIRMNDDVFSLPVVNCLWILMIGRRFDYGDPVLQNLWHLLTVAQDATFSRAALLAIFPDLGKMFPTLSGYKQASDFVEAFWSFLQENLKEHKETYVKGVRRDFLDDCIEEIKENDGKGVMTDEKIFPVFVDFFIAGVHTNVSSLGFIVLYLTLYPEVQRKVHQELEETIGKGVLPRLEDMKRLPYTTAFLLEVQRIAAVVPVTTRRALEDVELSGYRIPKGTPMYVNLHNVLMDPEHWKNPEKFQPERFINNDGDVVCDEVYIPFGLGRRRCVGEVFAKNLIFLFSTILLQNFRFSVPPNSPKPSTEVQDGLAIHPKPYDAFVETRFPDKEKN